MTVTLSQKNKKQIWEMIEKYENYNPELSNCLSKVLLNKATQEDLLTISQNMDYGDVHLSDFEILESIIGSEIESAFFNL